MKIVHIVQFYNDGMGYHENIFPLYHAKLGNDVVIITSLIKNNDANIDIDENTYDSGGVVVRRIKIKGMFKRRFVIFDNLPKYLEEEKPNYIFHHSVTSPSIKAVCNYKKRHPEVFIALDNHADLNISGTNKLWKIIYYNIYWKKIILKYDKFIDIYFGVTPIRCAFMEEEMCINKEKIRLLPIGVDVDNVVKSSRDDFLSKYKIDDDCFLIIHGGKISSEKQIGRIVEAFFNIKNQNIRLILFGKIYDPIVEKLIKRDKRIQFIGWLDRQDTLAALKHSDIGIWNTQHTTLLEDCIAVELPMLLRYYGSTSHLIDNTGLFLFEGSVREIQDKLLFIVNNQGIVSKFKENIAELRALLSYENVSKESIEYMGNMECKEIHKKFMSKEYSDFDYAYFRVINRN